MKLSKFLSHEQNSKTRCEKTILSHFPARKSTDTDLRQNSSHFNGLEWSGGESNIQNHCIIGDIHIK